jgi:hypothetical protein
MNEPVFADFTKLQHHRFRVLDARIHQLVQRIGESDNETLTTILTRVRKKQKKANPEHT